MVVAPTKLEKLHAAIDAAKSAGITNLKPTAVAALQAVADLATGIAADYETLRLAAEQDRELTATTLASLLVRTGELERRAGILQHQGA